MNASMRCFIASGLFALLIGCSGADTDTSSANSTETSTAVIAQELLTATLADAEKSDKRVFVHIGAPW